MTDKNAQISNMDEYKKWLKEEHGILKLEGEAIYYMSVANKVKAEFEQSALWTQLLKDFQEYDGEYLLLTEYNLLASDTPPTLHVKSFDSFLLKTFRKNILENSGFPEKPEGGWILPNNWYCRINDIVRTRFMVKYLDGVQFLAKKLRCLCEFYDSECEVHLEAKEKGYYAAHCYTKQESEIPIRGSFDTEKVNTSVEIQITTQLQELIQKLSHNDYRKRRTSSGKEENWQWDYRSAEFATYYLGHILHYVEGMIMEIREKQKEQ